MRKPSLPIETKPDHLPTETNLGRQTTEIKPDHLTTETEADHQTSEADADHLLTETKPGHQATDSQKMATTAGEALAEGKADKVVVLEVQGLTLIADYFVIASAPNQRHVRALADRVLEELSKTRKPHHIEGYEGGLWVLMDYGDFVVHVFREQERAFYGLERLWGDAPRVEIG